MHYSTVKSRKFYVFIVLLIEGLFSFRVRNSFSHKVEFHRNELKFSQFQSYYSKFLLNSGSGNIDGDFQEAIKSGDYSTAFKLIKRNPMLQLNMNYAKILLNNLDTLESSTSQDPEKALTQLTETCVFLYKRLERQKVLTGFGCVEGEYPEKGVEVSPARLEQVTGLSISALTPKTRTTYWRLAGIGLCIAEYLFGQSLGIDPLYTLIPATFLLFGTDQLLYRGAFFETIYRKLFPEYEQKIIYHEAGHFLISYLLGIPVRGCVTNAWDAKKYPEIQGQAGTIFYDSKLIDEINNKKVTRSSLDRLSIVYMAGIAAEAIKFNKAEGGAVDEQQLISFLSQVQPPWNILRIQGQARWAVMQAILLIREHQDSYDALVDALSTNQPVGNAIIAIEENLPKVLPSTKRLEERKTKKKESENINLMRHVQRMTWQANGITPIIPKSDELTSSSSSNTLDFIVEKNETDVAVKQFTDKIRMLEKALQSGDISSDIIATKENDGVWLNDLQSLKRERALRELPLNNNNSMIPQPKEGYEERISMLINENKNNIIIENNNNTIATTIINIDNNADGSFLPFQLDEQTSLILTDNSKNQIMTPEEMLKNYRGYQIKQLEIIENNKSEKLVDIDIRISQLKELINNSNKSLVKK
eukprot:gene7447-10148_t